MVYLILEQLVNENPPESISPNIASQVALAIPGVRVIVQELHSINCIHSCQTILRIIGETLAAYRISKVEQWDQFLSKGMGRRHNALQNLVIGVIYDGFLRLLIISTYIILKGETSE